MTAPESSRFDMLLACYRSGQMLESEWQAHIKDDVFAAWVRAVCLPSTRSPTQAAHSEAAFSFGTFH